MIIFCLILIQLVSYVLGLLIKNKSSGLLYCGLFGYSGANVADKTKLRWLAVMNEDRGKSSTGIYSLKGDKKASKMLEKATIMASRFIKTDEFSKSIEGAVMVIGHTRAATSGGVTVENAHPFEYNFGLKTVGAHNGFIAEVLLAKYLKDYELENKFDLKTMCDSQLIFAMLSKYNGDFNKLSEIEGGINTLFSFPDKYPDMLFAYKRAARTLHCGYSAEGIYLSSDSEPLENIGCYNVTSLTDNSITIFKNGEILDIQPIEPPKWHLPLGTTNNTYQSKLSFDEKAKYEETRRINNTSCNYHGPNKKPKHWNFKNEDEENTPQEYSVISNRKPSLEKTGTEDKFKMIIKDTIKEIGIIVDEPVRLTCADKIDYELDDLTDGLVVVNLIDSVHEEPLPGWVVMDREDSINTAAITGPSGVAILRYPFAKSNNGPRILHIYDPIDGASFYTFEVKPMQMRILEVILQIPFPQKKSIQTLGDEAQALLAGTHTRLAKLGADNNGKALPPNAEQISVRPSAGKDAEGISESKKSIRIRNKEQEVVGSAGSGCNKNQKDFMASRIERLRKQRGLAYSEGWIKEQLNNLVKARQQDQYIKFEADVIAVQTTKQYRELNSFLNTHLGKFLDLEDLLLDCCLLHVQANKRRTWTYAVSYYAVMLLTESIEDYWTPEFVRETKSEPIQRLDYKIVDELISLFYETLKAKMNQVSIINPEDSPAITIMLPSSLEEINTEAVNDHLERNDFYI